MAVNVTEIIEGARLNRFHLRVVVLCALLVAVDGFDLAAISYAANDFVKYLGVSRALMGTVFSAGFVGLTLGAMTFGLVGDRWGTRRTFVLCSLVFGAFSLATAAATSLTALLAFRAIAGWGLGGATPLAVAISTDYCPRRLRVPLTMIMYISLTLGNIVAASTYGFISVFGWRTVFILGGVVPILLAPLYLWQMPERIEYLVMKRAPAARIRAILARLAPGRDFSAETRFDVPAENKESFQLAQLFQDGRAAITTMLWIVFFTSLLSLYFFSSWLPALLADYGLSKTQIVEIASSMSLGGIAGTLVTAPIVVGLGGFRTMSLGYLLGAVAIVILAKGGSSFAFLFVASLAVGFLLIAAQGVLNALCAALYPPAIRATAVGWGFGVGRCAAILSPSLAGILLALHWKATDLFLLAALPVLCAAAAGAVVMVLVRRRERQQAAQSAPLAA